VSAVRIPVGVLGATGTVGQRFLARLADHPDFEIAALAASDRSAGRSYSDASPWRLAEPPPPGLADWVLRKAEPDLPCRIVFSALDAESAREVEPRFARAGYLVFSNASAHRMEDDVPLLVPEVNAGHARLLAVQRSRRGWDGGILTNPNCSATQLVLALAPLDRAFGVEKALVTTMQAVSGAGYPGVASLDALANILPDIPDEADKVESETNKILGRYDQKDGRVVPATLIVSAHTYRVPVENGHTESVSVQLSRPAAAAEIVAAWRQFRAGPDVAALPSSPARPLEYLEEAHAPQPRRHAERERGMVTWIGGLSRCSVLDWKFTVVGNNTVRGAAGGSLLNAELYVRSEAPAARREDAS
jgi:aspartate-semialdehyde dehydrogenase